MERREGLKARLKKNRHPASTGGELYDGEIFILTQLTKKTGGTFFDPEARGYSNNWVWYVKRFGFKPCSGQWWSDHPNFRKNLDLSPPNPFMAMASEHSNG